MIQELDFLINDSLTKDKYIKLLEKEINANYLDIQKKESDFNEELKNVLREKEELNTYELLLLENLEEFHNHNLNEIDTFKHIKEMIESDPALASDSKLSILTNTLKILEMYVYFSPSNAGTSKEIFTIELENANVKRVIKFEHQDNWSYAISDAMLTWFDEKGAELGSIGSLDDNTYSLKSLKDIKDFHKLIIDLDLGHFTIESIVKILLIFLSYNVQNKQTLYKKHPFYNSFEPLILKYPDKLLNELF